LLGAKNTIPSFISANGPVREARFIKNPNGTPDGGVHDLYHRRTFGCADLPALLSRSRILRRRSPRMM
jgi:hypothetical protein